MINMTESLAVLAVVGWLRGEKPADQAANALAMLADRAGRQLQVPQSRTQVRASLLAVEQLFTELGIRPGDRLSASAAVPVEAVEAEIARLSAEDEARRSAALFDGVPMHQGGAQ